MSVSHAVYSARRSRLAELIGEGVAIIPTAQKMPRNADTDFPFRPSSHFYYLTGFSESEAILLVMGGATPRSVLFCRGKDASSEPWKDRKGEIWSGRRMGPEVAKASLGFDEAYPIEEFKEKFREFAHGTGKYYSVGKKEDWDSRVTNALMSFSADPDNPGEGKDISPLLDNMRMIKDETEIEAMRKAASISSAAHRKAMEACRPGTMEYELEAVLGYWFRSRGGASLPAYSSIVAGGNNACILHYPDNNCALRDGDLVLIDAGCEYGCYASDITRTFPVNGKFSPEQKALYELVLKAQLAAIAEVRPGAKFFAPHKKAWLLIAAGLLDLGIISGDLESICTELLMGKGPAMRFVLHSVSHFLGLDAHDLSRDLRGTTEHPRLLEPGMVLTVEPGVYIPQGAEGVDPKWRGMGIRIEDDVLVTKAGYEVLSAEAPKTVEEIEAIMK